MLAVAALVDCPVDPDSKFPAEFPGEVKIHLTDGRTARRRVTSSYGTAGDRMGDDAVHDKFRSVAGRILPNDQVTRIADLVARLHGITDVTELIDACISPNTIKVRASD